MPTQPTQEQLDARMNPTPFNVTLPGTGFFRGVGDYGSTLYRELGGGKAEAFDLAGLGKSAILRDAGIANEQAAPSGFFNGMNNGTFASRGVQELKSKYGIDYNSLSQINIGDYMQAMNKTYGMSLPTTGFGFSQGDINTLQGVQQKTSGATSTQAMNTEKPTIASAADIAQQQKDPNWVTGAPPITGSPYQSSGVLDNKNVPGGTATNLKDYYEAIGKTLPPVAERGLDFEKLGLGAAATYKGSLAQNEALLEALHRKDYSATTFGAGTGKEAAATNSTPAGMSLAAALGGKTASETLSNYSTYLANALGKAEKDLSGAETSVQNFFTTRKTSEQILQEELDRRGITQSQSLLSDLDKQITKQQDLLEALPENIRNSLADVGVSQAQLERLTLKEAQKPDQMLKSLLEKRNALASDINEAVQWAGKFADTRIADQAAKLAAMQWEVNNDKDKYGDLKDDARTVLNNAIDEKKSIFEIAKTAAEHGATTKQIDAILASSTKEGAVTVAGRLLVAPKTTSATSQITTEIKDAGTALELGLADKGYNGRGADGFVDPNLYVSLYNQALQLYGATAAAQFLDKYPPAKNINPANLGTGTLPGPIENAVAAGKAKAAPSITIDPALIKAALQN